MKKYLTLAAAAIFMMAACQKTSIGAADQITDPTQDNDLVEIQFSTNLAVVETKTEVTNNNFIGLEVYVTGQNITNTAKHAFEDVSATVGGDGKLTITNSPYYYNGSDKYKFYGYYLDGAGDSGTTTVTIGGQNDILLASTTGEYSAKEARAGNHPSLEFKHALSKFTFKAINLGTADIILSDIKITTPIKGTITLSGDSQGISPNTEKGEIPASDGDYSLPSKSSATPTDTDYSEVGIPVMVFPNSTYSLTFTIKQEKGDGIEERSVTTSISGDIIGGNSYNLKIKLYSEEKIEVSATLTPWTPGEDIEVDTESQN